MLPQHEPLFMQALADHEKFLVFFGFQIKLHSFDQFALFTSLEFLTI